MTTSYVRGGQWFECRQCSQMFRGYPSQRPKYCSVACRRTAQRADDATLARLWSRTTIVGTCWVASGTPDKDGYIQFWAGNKNRRAHTVGWELANGPIPQGVSILHHCDNPACWRNDAEDGHLFPGTQADNMADKTAKGRQARGEGHGCAKLGADMILRIRQRWAAGETQTRLAIEFGVSQANISEIVRGKSWRHLAEGPTA